MKQSILFLLLVAATACSKKNPVAPVPDYAKFVESIAEKADTLPPEAVYQMALTLQSPEWQDSFYQTVFQQKIGGQRYAEIGEQLPFYEKLRAGKPGPDLFIVFTKAMCAQTAREYPVAEAHYQRAVALAESIRDTGMLINILSMSGGTFSSQGKLSQAVQQLLRSLELAERANDADQATSARKLLAVAFNKLNEPDKAIELGRKNIAHSSEKGESQQLGYMHQTMGQSFFQKNDLDSAVFHQKRALEIRRKFQLPAPIAESLTQIANTLAKQGRWPDALKLAEEAWAIAQKSQNRQPITAAGIIFGQCLLKTGRQAEGEKMLLEMSRLAEAGSQPFLAVQSARSLAIFYKEHGKLAEALHFTEQKMALGDTLLAREKKREIIDLTTRFEVREQGQKIAALTRENQLATQRNWWIGGLSALLVGALVMFAFHRARRQQELFEKEKLVAEARAELLAAEVKSQQIELDANRDRLRDFTQMLLERNTRAVEIAQQLAETSTRAGDHQPDQPESGQPGYSEAMTALYNQKILTDDDWLRFQNYFSSVYPGFIPALKSQFKTINPGEMRLMLLHKMGSDIKESAVILGVGLDSIKKGRYRLRKKLREEVGEFPEFLADF